MKGKSGAKVGQKWGKRRKYEGGQKKYNGHFENL